MDLDCGKGLAITILDLVLYYNFDMFAQFCAKLPSLPTLCVHNRASETVYLA